MIIVTGTFDLADPSLTEATIEATVPFQRATRKDEAGCRAYVLSADPCVPGRIQMYELWDDEDALAAHFEHPNYTGLLQELGGMELDASEATRYTVHTAKALYGDAG